MSMLNFKHGLYGNLFNADGSNKVAISNGTIYVTTDEKAMYVDLDGNRIRLSQIVNIPNIETWQNLTPPYSTEAFYYIVKENALLKYTGEDWVQINSTAELDALIAGLGIYTVAPASPKNGDILVKDGKVSIYDADAEGTKWIDYGTIGSKLLDVSDRVGALATTVAGHGTDITNLKTRATDIETAAAETRTAVGFLGKMDATPATGTLGQTVLVGEQVYIWLAKAGETPEGWQPVDSLGKRVEDLKARIEEVALTAGDQSAVEDLQEALGTLEDLVTADETGLAATKAIADKAASDLATYVENHKDDYTNAALDTAIADAKKAGTDAADALNAYKTTNNEAMTALGNRVKALEDAGYVKANGTVAMSGALDLGGNKIIEVATPTDNTDAANKAYVDNQRKAIAGTNTDGSVYSEHTLKDAYTKADQAVTDLNTHIDDKNNPHEVTAEQVGLGKVENKTTEEIKAGFTGAVADGNEGFVTGDAVYDAIKDAKDALTGDANSVAGSATISGANKAAAVAQETATNAANAAAAITKDASTEYDTLKKVEEKIKSINKDITDLGDTYATDDEVETAINNVLGNAETDTAASQTIAGAHKAAAAATEAASTQKNRVDTILTGATDYDTLGKVETKFDVLDQTIANLGNTYATDAELATEKSNILGEYTDGAEKKSFTGTVGSVYDKAVQNAANITTVGDRVTALKTQVEGALQAADAMVYKGTVSVASDLPTVAQKGWTYKATTDIAKATFAEGSVIWATVSNQPKDELYVRAGDLFIATGDEGDNGNITNLKWDHVPAGYNADYVPTMSTSVSNGVAKIELTSAHAATNEKGDLGSFQVSAAANSAVTVSVAEGNNIAIGMTWGTF